MRKKILLITFIITIYSCGVDRIYTPANYATSKKYIAKPIYNDTISSAYYGSFSISNGKHPYKNESKADTKLIGVLSLHHSKSLKKYNFYYGIGISYGSFNFKNSLYDIIKENETHSFYIINPKIGGSIKKSTSNFDYHYIGLELNYNYENGSYHDKLSKITPTSSIKVVNEKSLFTYNFFSEFIYKINIDNSIGLGAFIGGVAGLNTTKYDIQYNDGIGFGGLTFSYRFKKTTFSLILEDAAQGIQSINYGINYQF